MITGQLRFGAPAVCWAILAASFEPMLFWPVVFDGVTVYDPAPKPVSVYVPPGNEVVVETLGEPAPLITAFDTKRGVGVPIALP